MLLAVMMLLAAGGQAVVHAPPCPPLDTLIDLDARETEAVLRSARVTFARMNAVSTFDQYDESGMFWEASDNSRTEGTYVIDARGICVTADGEPAQVCRKLMRSSSGGYYMYFPRTRFTLEVIIEKVPTRKRLEKRD